MERTREGLTEALKTIPKLREEFWKQRARPRRG